MFGYLLCWTEESTVLNFNYKHHQIYNIIWRAPTNRCAMGFFLLVLLQWFSHRRFSSRLHTLARTNVFIFHIVTCECAVRMLVFLSNLLVSPWKFQNSKDKIVDHAKKIKSKWRDGHPVFIHLELWLELCCVSVCVCFGIWISQTNLL